MSYPVPNYLLPLDLLAAVAILGAVYFGLRSALSTAGWPPAERRRAIGEIMALLAGWFLIAFFLSWLGLFQGQASHPPTIQYGVLIPIIVGVALFRWWPTLRRVIDAVPQQWIVGLQLYRAMGFTFLALLAAGLLPGVFAWPAGSGDVLVGLLAPLVAVAYARSTRGSAALVLAWNLLGLTDLVVALTTGFLSSPSPFQQLAIDTPNRLITAFPLVLVPVYFVPLAVLLHFASLKKLRGSQPRQAT
jgi:hypothetical protein